MIVELRQVTKEYPKRNKSLFRTKEYMKAVNNVNLQIGKGDSIGLVGESGCGKSTIAKLITRLETVTSGQILLKGKPIHGKKISNRELYKQIQLVLQDSSSSLHPKMQIKDILLEPLQHYFPSEKSTWEESCKTLLKLVDLDEAFLLRYPYQLSGGQKQRVCIAKSLAAQPDIIIFDESIASLDEESQQSMIRTLKKIKKQYELTYLFITHDLRSTRELCDRIVVMYQGEFVETFRHHDYEKLKHPYSRILFQTLNNE
ncbi:ABC transporter ATP-binding protein [Metabacillus sp. B2-18]|uniref:ABC transporter ATP-binding protein n=1 Tax=Metabacillus sp. B2-18 TaxID=2897333 RepID=UPI001E3418AD|nr:dipeptide/oligopeptide/nickel ABC transporter ATP-binding protein [Metabacillus sp. B2-18]UGB32007.1 dipeptide/oligopeptide/nickel ABC transporter ATP-binding protein [Metabacillus sp. B2-18]